MVVTLDQLYNIGEKPTVILYTYINRHAGRDTRKTAKKTKNTHIKRFGCRAEKTTSLELLYYTNSGQFRSRSAEQGKNKK